MSVTAVPDHPEFDFGDRIRKVRRSVAHLSQADMAASIGVSQKVYSSWETGRTRPSDIIAVAKRIESNWRGTESPPPPQRRAPNHRKIWIAIGIAVPVLLFGGCAACMAMIAGSGHYDSNAPVTLSFDQIKSRVVEACEADARSKLRDPDSARFSDTGIFKETTGPQDGDRKFLLIGGVNARNGFGGYSGEEPYTCDATVTSRGQVSVSTELSR
jgi:DNA-binding XRE family transcriptional regulator